MPETPTKTKRSITRPRAKSSEPEIRWWNRLTLVVVILMLLAAVIFAIHIGRHDRSGAAILQAADWLSRLPLALGSLTLAVVAWWIHVQLIDFTQLAKWAWAWDMKLPSFEEWKRDHANTRAPWLQLGLEYGAWLKKQRVEWTEDPIIRAAKTLGWSIYLAASLFAFCQVISKAMGA